jgi:ribosome biogenesis GTPase
MATGRIVNLNAGVYQILDGNNIIEARARGKFRKMKLSKESAFNKGNNNKLSNKIDTQYVKLSPKVGDLVTYELNDGINYITDLEPRKNDLIRPDICNVDQIILIMSAKEPDFSSYLLDLFIVNLKSSNIKPIIIISKIDLASEEELNKIKETMSYYKEKLDYEVFYVNSKDLNTDLSEIKELLKNKITVLSGQTGAGKSTFINALIPGFNLATQEISDALNRGKHTTRQIHLYQEFGGLVGDTPGFSKLEIFVEQSDLASYFPEFKQEFCRFKDCRHLKGSKDCGVIENVGKTILKSRYDNYIKIYEKIEKDSKRY